MDQKERLLREKIRTGLINLVDKTLEDKDVGPDLLHLMKIFNIPKELLVEEVLAYTLGKGVDEYKNKHYQKLAARLTLHFHNLVKETYHRKRQDIILSFLRKIKPNHIIDIGYGTPAPYFLSYMSENQNATATLADQDPSAEEFAREILLNKNPNVLERTKFTVYDMDSGEYPEDANMYIYLDSIEHTQKPTEYLNKMVKSASIGSYFVFSIPICSMKGLENFHYYEWLTDGESRNWITASGLKILDEDVVYPNPEVDYFAELVEGGYHNHLVLAQKLV